MKRTAVVLTTCGVIAAATVMPVTSASAAGGKGQLCDFGTFHVVHKGNRINDVKVKQGYYKIYHRKVKCRTASNLLTQWLSTGETTRDFLVAAGTRGKKSLMFSKGQGPKFFQIKWVRGG